MARKIAVEITGDASSLERSFHRAQVSANGFNRDISRSIRGAAAGSGIFRGLGRSIAFASGGFLAFASAGEAIRKSIDAATEDAAVQRQLAAQFKANKQSLSAYTQVIQDHTMAVSRLSGFNDTELTQSFTTAFRASKNVAESLKLQSVAADAARGTNKPLAVVTLALTKALIGQSGALHRLGILVPKTLQGMAALNFVQQKFAGQAQAGTTAQQRFGAAIHNTEITIGRAVLPTLNKYLNKATKWLDTTENQRKIEKELNTVLHGTGTVLGAVGDAWTVAAAAAKKYDSVVSSLGKKKNSGIFGELFKVLFAPGYGLKELAHAFEHGGGGPAQTRSQAPPGYVRGTHGMAPSTRQNPGGYLTARQLTARGLDPSSYGKGASTAANPSGFLSATTRATAGTSPAGPLGFNARMAKLALALAKAELTASDSDDRAILTQEAALIKERLGKVKSLKDRTALYQQLGQVEQQIAGIDSQATADRKAAAAKELAAKRKEAELARQQAAKIKAAEAKLRGVMANVHQAFTSALDNARSQIGDLFSGPVLNPTAAQTKQLLGVPGPTAAGLTRDVIAQTRQSARFQHDLGRLRKQALAGGLSKAGANELIKELRAQGVSAIPQIEALTNASPAARAKFLAAFGAREQFAHRVAQMTVQARTVHISTSRLPIHVTVELDGKAVAKVVTDHQDKAKGRTASQTRGRHGGR